MAKTPETAKGTEWSLDRELVIARVLNAPREKVFRAWTEPDQIGKWFGPNGFVCHIHAMDVRVGGRWRFDLIASDGTVYDNRVDYLEIVPPERLVFDHGHDRDDDPSRFRVTVTFDAQGEDKTIVTLRQLHSTAERRREVIAFGAVELGLQTLDKLAAHVSEE